MGVAAAGCVAAGCELLPTTGGCSGDPGASESVELSEALENMSAVPEKPLDELETLPAGADAPPPPLPNAGGAGCCMSDGHATGK